MVNTVISVQSQTLLTKTKISYSETHPEGGKNSKSNENPE